MNSSSAARDNFKEHFGSGRYYTAIWRDHPRDQTPGTRIIPHLKQEGVHVLH